ncbi:glycosyltransferase involved in cell wall biosynthesis [Lutibacter sp. Hel_I_33_5]|uniref:glycosyltransferase n=1 Tax=Lutibacter sp. Hel_I_33_5 TaxID=1566289 RepID=UPI00119F004C|nr:glycosyltransferase [Lutibacter sp. Hel_I_33_5]TVZ56913.1 glycosyltransferase involved in cell wall biosynthesis [Lutibacter sp. Hel_I_33_5]
MKKIIVSVTNDLSTDQRVAKVCNTLHANGFDVLLVGRELKNSSPIIREYSTKRMNLFFNSSFLFYAEYNFRLFFFLLFTKKDILLSNDVDSLIANFLVSKIQRKKIVFDSHELFSEVPELVDKNLVKKVWLQIEKWVIPKLKNNYTVCKSIADIYKDTYKSEFKVIKNIPLYKETETGNFPFNYKEEKVIIYQGAINMGRGLELMIDTMKYLPNYIFVIIGDGDIFIQLKKKVKKESLENNVKLLGKLSPEELQKLTPLANLGISFEEDLGLNYRYALPNKIFDYIQAEIPILVSNLPEMKQVVLDYNVGGIIKNRDPKIIAKQIEALLDKDFSKELCTAKKALVWEKQEKQLLSIFNNLH